MCVIQIKMSVLKRIVVEETAIASTLLGPLTVSVVMDSRETHSPCAQVRQSTVSLCSQFEYFVVSVDIDECSTNIGGCSDDCVNTIGSFFCTCPTGFQLDVDGRTCIGMSILYMH